MPLSNAHAVLARFGLDSRETGLERVSQGYINDTYRVTLKGSPAYILQNIP